MIPAMNLKALPLCGALVAGAFLTVGNAQAPRPDARTLAAAGGTP